MVLVWREKDRTKEREKKTIRECKKRYINISVFIKGVFLRLYFYLFI